MFFLTVKSAVQIATVSIQFIEELAPVIRYFSKSLTLHFFIYTKGPPTLSNFFIHSINGTFVITPQVVVSKTIFQPQRS